jgi:putative intracellular protease/amidase
MKPVISRLKHIIRVLSYVLAALATILIGGVLGLLASQRVATPPLPSAVAGAISAWPAPTYAADRPTVAIVLGETSSEVTDVLGPYAMFATTEAYNVYTVAATRAPHTLSGGLAVVPHYSFAELDATLGHAPDIIVAPAIGSITDPSNAPLLDWLRQHAAGGSVMFSWCTGAEVLAAAGLLDGKSATAHWGDLGSMEQRYPAVHWQRGVRYVDAGQVLTSAGLTAGIDATLYLLRRLHGPDLAAQLVSAMHYPSAQYAASPAATQYEMTGADSVYMLNVAFYWPKEQLGVWLHDGVDELDLAAAFDVYTASWTTQATTLGATASVRSRHGLQLIPRWTAPNLPRLGRVLALGDAASVSTALAQAGQPDATLVVASEQSQQPGFAFETLLELFSATGNGPTARFAAKRLEYRADSLELAGGIWPLRVIIWPFLLGSLGLGLRWAVGRWWGRRPSAVVSG